MSVSLWPGTLGFLKVGWGDCDILSLRGSHHRCLSLKLLIVRDKWKST